MANTGTAVRPFGMRDKLGYMFGDFGNDFTFMLSSSFMMVFYTDIMGVPAAIVGLLMMVARFVDAFTDVAMGQIVDRAKPTKDGRFRPWIKRMCGPVAIASFLIYQSEFAGMPMAFKVVWMFVTYILWGSIFYTSINIPYGSMASAISPEANDRTQLSTFRSIGATLANLVIGTATPLLAYETVNGTPQLSGSRMLFMAGLFSVCAIICYIICFNLTTERVVIPAKTEKFEPVALLKRIFTSRSLLGIILAALCLLLTMLTMTGMPPSPRSPCARRLRPCLSLRRWPPCWPPRSARRRPPSPVLSSAPPSIWSASSCILRAAGSTWASIPSLTPVWACSTPSSGP